MNISLKESRESQLWLRLIRDANISELKEENEYLLKESTEIKNILGKIVLESRKNNENKG